MRNINTQKWNEYIIVSIILVLALTARLYRIDAPLADWHSWRQADTSSVTRRFLNDGTDLLHPRYDDLSSIPSGLENPEGWRFVEFPMVNAATALLVNAVPLFNLEEWGRLTSIAFSLGSIVILFLIVKQAASVRLALISSAVFALLPFNVYFHRTILPEVPMLFFSLLAIHFFMKWLTDQTPIAYAVSLASFAAGMLLKPYILFTTPLLVYLAFGKWGWGFLRHLSLYLYLMIAAVPFLLWRVWAFGFPEGVPAYDWLFNGSGIRFRPAFFRWIFAERLGKLILGYWGVLPFGLGLMQRPKAKTGWIFHWWLIAMLGYLVVFATGNVTHDYYQIFIIPPIAVFVAQGIVGFLEHAEKRNSSRVISYSLLIISLSFMFGFAWFHVRDYFNINRPEIVEAGKAADQILPKEAKVIAPYQGDTAFLYQTKRQGWPIGGDIPGKIALGATDYVTVNRDEEAEWLMERCKPSLSLEKFTIVSLKHCSL